MAVYVAEARNLTSDVYESIIVFGSTAPNDGGGGIYLWNATATNADDGLLWIKPEDKGDLEPGRWQRVTKFQSWSLATAAQIRSGTADVLITPEQWYAAHAPVNLATSGTIGVNLSVGTVFSCTLTGNGTLANPTGQIVGKSGEIWIIQGGSGGYTLSYAANYYFIGSAPVLASAVGSVAVIAYRVMSSGVIRCSARVT